MQGELQPLGDFAEMVQFDPKQMSDIQRGNRALFVCVQRQTGEIVAHSRQRLLVRQGASARRFCGVLEGQIFVFDQQFITALSGNEFHADGADGNGAMAGL